MALAIVKYPDPRLRQYQTDVDPLEVRDRIEEMKRRAQEHGSLVGIAANQMGWKGRYTVIENQQTGEWFHLINPIIVWRSDMHAVEIEGCGSLPGIKVPVFRPVSIDVKAIMDDSDENYVTKRFHDFQARIICHEIDHLNGVLLTDYGLGTVKEEKVSWDDVKPYV